MVVNTGAIAAHGCRRGTISRVADTWVCAVRACEVLGEDARLRRWLTDNIGRGATADRVLAGIPHLGAARGRSRRETNLIRRIARGGSETTRDTCAGLARPRAIQPGWGCCRPHLGRLSREVDRRATRDNSDRSKDDEESGILVVGGLLDH